MTGALEMPSPHEEWLALVGTWRRLHRIAEIEPVDLADGLPNGPGKAICGVSGHFCVPGVFSRMGLPRCAHCCDLLGIPRGKGNTLNAGIQEPAGQRWEHYDELQTAWYP